MKRDSSAVFIPFDPNAPKKRRQRRSTSLASTYGQVLSFASDTPDTPRSVPTQDENQASLTLSSPWMPTPSNWMPTPQFRNWTAPTPAMTGSDTDSAFSSNFSGARLGLSNDDDPFTNSTAREHSAADPPLVLPSESPPVLLKFRRRSSHGSGILGTPGVRAYKPLNTPSAAQSTWDECKENVLQTFSDAARSPLDLILDLLDPTQSEYENYRSRWFSPTCNKLSLLLDRIFSHPKGNGLILQWMRPHVLDSVCSLVSSEMDLVVNKLYLPSVEHISSEFINDWTLETVIEPAIQLCPSLSRILEAAAQTVEAKRKNKIKFPKTVRIK